MKTKLLTLSLVLVLGGCIAQSRIQAKYMDQEATCRSEAQTKVQDAPPPPEGTVRNENSTAIFAAFSACMNKAGWKVSVPKTTTTAAGTPPPSGAPGPGGVVAVRSGSNAAAAPILGPGVQPSPAPAYGNAAVVAAPAAVPVAAPAPHAVPAAAPTPAPVVPDSPASYQPAGRPDGVTPPEYGSGAGRQF